MTPSDDGAIGLLEATLAPFGFALHRFDRGGIVNLFAVWAPPGDATGPTFAFAGHTDVVPTGDAAVWSHHPFGADLVDGVIWGRGATDMKSGVAAFVSAACRS